MTSGSPALSSRFSRGRNKKGRTSTIPTADRPAKRLSIARLGWKEHDVQRRDGRYGVRASRPRRWLRVELVDAKHLGARPEAMLGELAEVGGALEDAGSNVRRRSGGPRGRERETLRAKRHPHPASHLGNEAGRCRRCKLPDAAGNPHVAPLAPGDLSLEQVGLSDERGHA